MIDIEKARLDTPGSGARVHLNSAGASLPPTPVLDAVVSFLRGEALDGPTEAQVGADELLDNARSMLGQLSNCETDRVAFCTSASSGWTDALWGLRQSGWFSPGDYVLVDRSIYVTHFLALLQLKAVSEIRIVVVGDSTEGSVSMKQVADRLDERVRLVAVTHAPAHRGIVNPVEEIGELLDGRERCAYFVDAAQSIGQLSVDVERIYCDVLVGSGRKFLRAPRGSAVAVVSPRISDVLDPPGIDALSATWVSESAYSLHSGAKRLERYEGFIAGRVGLGKAAEYALAVGIVNISKRIELLAERLRSGLAAREHVVLLDGERARSGIVVFRIRGATAKAVQGMLSRMGYSVGLVKPWIALLDESAWSDGPCLRASLHYYNLEEDVVSFLDAVDTCRPVSRSS
jgi:cysteine desulfurase / selenocysteine lyase